jgi:hypothetical protein
VARPRSPAVQVATSPIRERSTPRNTSRQYHRSFRLECGGVLSFPGIAYYDSSPCVFGGVHEDIEPTAIRPTAIGIVRLLGIGHGVRVIMPGIYLERHCSCPLVDQSNPSCIIAILVYEDRAGDFALSPPGGTIKLSLVSLQFRPRRAVSESTIPPRSAGTSLPDEIAQKWTLPCNQV